MHSNGVFRLSDLEQYVHLHVLKVDGYKLLCFSPVCSFKQCGSTYTYICIHTHTDTPSAFPSPLFASFTAAFLHCSQLLCSFHLRVLLCCYTIAIALFLALSRLLTNHLSPHSHFIIMVCMLYVNERHLSCICPLTALVYASKQMGVMSY